MDITIVTASHVALYRQIAEQIKKMILDGVLHEGDMLPSVRALAKELGVSIITTRRAYTELEHEGFVITTPAKGSFVSFQYHEKLRELGLLKLETILANAVLLAKSLNIDEEHFQQIARNLYLKSTQETHR